MNTLKRKSANALFGMVVGTLAALFVAGLVWLLPYWLLVGCVFFIVSLLVYWQMESHELQLELDRRDESLHPNWSSSAS